jgi:hypothetical protein
VSGIVQDTMMILASAEEFSRATNEMNEVMNGSTWSVPGSDGFLGFWKGGK